MRRTPTRIRPNPGSDSCNHSDDCRGHAGSETLPPNSTQVQFTLTPAANGGTLVEVEHRNLPAEHLPSHRIGWPMFMDRLRTTTSP